MDLSHPAAAVLLYHEAVDKDMTPFIQKKIISAPHLQVLESPQPIITRSSNFIDNKKMEGKYYTKKITGFLYISSS